MNYLYNEAAVCLILRLLDRGEQAILAALDLVHETGSSKWFNTLMVGVYVRLHAKNYRGAFDYYKMATTHDRFSTLFPANQDIFRLLGAHLKALEQRKRLKLGFQDEDWFKGFDETVFLSNEFAFNADKQGLNVTSFLVQILILPHRGEREMLATKADALRKYAERHLVEASIIRSKLAVDAFLKLSEFVFENAQEAILEIGLELRQKLIGHPILVYSQHHELEMMPFDDLAFLFLEPG